MKQSEINAQLLDQAHNLTDEQLAEALRAYVAVLNSRRYCVMCIGEHSKVEEISIFRRNESDYV